MCAQAFGLPTNSAEEAFISYAHLDARTYAAELAYDLRMHGYTSFLDQWELPPAEDDLISARPYQRPSKAVRR